MRTGSEGEASAAHPRSSRLIANCDEARRHVNPGTMLEGSSNSRDLVISVPVCGLGVVADASSRTVDKIVRSTDACGGIAREKVRANVLSYPYLC